MGREPDEAQRARAGPVARPAVEGGFRGCRALGGHGALVAVGGGAVHHHTDDGEAMTGQGQTSGRRRPAHQARLYGACMQAGAVRSHRRQQQRLGPVHSFIQERAGTSSLVGWALMVQVRNVDPCPATTTTHSYLTRAAEFAARGNHPADVCPPAMPVPTSPPLQAARRCSRPHAHPWPGRRGTEDASGPLATWLQARRVATFSQPEPASTPPPRHSTRASHRARGRRPGPRRRPVPRHHRVGARPRAAHAPSRRNSSSPAAESRDA